MTSLVHCQMITFINQTTCVGVTRFKDVDCTVTVSSVTVYFIFQNLFVIALCVHKDFVVYMFFEPLICHILTNYFKSFFWFSSETNYYVGGLVACSSFS